MYNQFLQKLKDKEPFTFSRFGDGEFASLLNLRPEIGQKNADGHEFFPDMGEALANVLKSKPEYYVGMQRFAREDRYPEQIEKFLNDNDLNGLNWVNADVWHHASIHGDFEEFFEALKTRSVVFVAPAYLKSLNKFSCGFVTVADQNCWFSRQDVINEIKSKWVNTRENVVFIFCASMPAKVMIHELYQEFGKQHTFLDAGSVFDPYVGKASRSYHKKIIARLNG